MKTPLRHGWWADDPAVDICDLCGCPIQRTPTGTVADGMRLHIATVHEGVRPVSVDQPKAGAS